MIVDLEDYIESDVLPISKCNSIHYLIIKRDEDDFILVSTKDFIYSIVDRISTSEELEYLGIFPRKGERVYTWSDYKQLINDRNAKEIDKPF